MWGTGWAKEMLKVPHASALKRDFLRGPAGGEDYAAMDRSIVRGSGAT